MITLNVNEQTKYAEVLQNLTAAPFGKFYFRDIYPDKAPCSRIAIVFRKDVVNGTLPGVVLAGKYSDQGYIKFNALHNSVSPAI